MTTISHTLSPSPTFPVVDDKLTDDFVDDFDDSDEIPDCLRARMIQNEDGEWVYQLTDEDRAAIALSRQAYAEGRWSTHEEVMARTRKWLLENS